MFLLLFAVPGLVVVLVGYVLGHGLWRWIGGMVDATFGTSMAAWAELAGWMTGTLLLAGSVRCIVVVLRRRRRGHAR